MLPKINLFRLPMLMPDDGDGNGGGAPNGNDGDGRDDQPLGDAGKRALDAERARAEAAEKKVRELERQNAKREQADREAADKAAAEQGQFKELAEQREADLTSTKASLDAANAELAVLRDYASKQLAAAQKDFPEVVKAFAPADDAPLTERLAWLEKAAAQAKKIEQDTPRGNGGNPPPSGGGQGPIESPVPKSKLM